MWQTIWCIVFFHLNRFFKYICLSENCCGFLWKMSGSWNSRLKEMFKFFDYRVHCSESFCCFGTEILLTCALDVSKMPLHYQISSQYHCNCFWKNQYQWMKLKQLYFNQCLTHFKLTQCYCKILDFTFWIKNSVRWGFKPRDIINWFPFRNWH